ncbi:MAG: ABC transporter permease [Tunicatimonas sp.]
MKNSPPRWARRLLYWYCNPNFVEDLEGDLEELYEERLRQMSHRKARWYYARDVLLLFRPTIIRPLTFNRLSSNQLPAMYRNYFKTGFRNLLRYRGYALLNIFGLAIGMAAAIVLFLIVSYERSFDTFHSQHDQIYRLGEQEVRNGKTDAHDLTPVPVVPTLLEEIPEVVAGTRFFAPNNIRLRYQDHTANPLVHFVDSGFVELFSFELVDGDLRQTLTTVNRLVLTKSVAKKLFGNEEAVGKTLAVVNDKRQFTVGAVLADPPANSSLQFEALLPWANAPDWIAKDANWYDTFMTGFAKLSDHADPAALSEKLLAFKTRHYDDEKSADVKLHLRPLAQLRAFDTNNQPIINLLGLIAALTLLIASVNFMNLATAQSLLRTREIGVRKALGSLRRQLVGQFLTESLLTTLLALTVGILLVHGTLPWFNRYFDLPLTFRYWQNLPLLGALLGGGLLVGLLAGMYPALFVSRLSPVASLKGHRQRGTGRWLQQSLIVVQYVASIVLIAGTVVIWRQIQFMQSQDLRFDQENVVGFSLWYDNYAFQSEGQAKSVIKTMINRLENESSIVGLTFAEHMPGHYIQNYNSFYDSEAPAQNPVSMRQVTVGDRYFETLGMHLVMGRLPSPELAPDSGLAVVINETALRALGWIDTEDKYLTAEGDATRLPVIGVVQDYHYQSLQEKIQPMVHGYYPGDEYYYGHLAARLQPGRTTEGLAVLESAYQSLNPYEPFDYYFLDAEFDKMYRTQERLGFTATLFAGIAVVLASLGLLALAAFATQLRRKEVGVRKVLGASVAQIIVLLSRNFAGLVAIAFLVACPLIYYAAERFLQDFAYRIGLGADVFLIAGGVALLVAGFSVSAQALRAASENPVDALRDE